MLKLSFDPFPELITDRLLLREVVPADLPEIHFHRTDPEMNKFISKERAKSISETEEWMKNLALRTRKNEWIYWGISPGPGEKLIGGLCFWNISKKKEIAETGYSIHPDFQGKGYMKEAMKAIIQYGFDTMGLKRIDAYTRNDNQPSIQLLEKLGFNLTAKKDRDYPLNLVFELSPQKFQNH